MPVPTKYKATCMHQWNPSRGRELTFLSSSGGVFIVIFVGIALACITLLGEYWYYKYWKPSRMTSPTQNPKVLAVRPDPAVSKTNFNTEYK